MNFQAPVLEVMKVVRKAFFPLSLSSCPWKPELSEAQHFRQRETRAASSAFSRPSLAACAGESSRERAWITRRYLLSSFIIFEIFSLFSCRDHPDKTWQVYQVRGGRSLGEEAPAAPMGGHSPDTAGTTPQTRPRLRAMPGKLQFFIPGNVQQWVLSLFKQRLKSGSMHHQMTSVSSFFL